MIYKIYTMIILSNKHDDNDDRDFNYHGISAHCFPKNALWDLFEVAESPALPLGPFRPKPPLVKTKGLRVEVSERRLEGPNNSHTKYSCQAFWLCNSFSAFA